VGTGDGQEKHKRGLVLAGLLGNVRGSGMGACMIHRIIVAISIVGVLALLAGWPAEQQQPRIVKVQV
jgi:hypothetical protein